MRNVPRRYSRQRGAIIVWFALFMMTMLSFVALGIDIAKLAATRTQLQNSADAAALAAASAIDPYTGRLDPAVALIRAQKAGVMNEAFIDIPQPTAIEPADVLMVGPNRVQVTVRRQGASSMVTTMAQVLGIKSIETTASATALADTAESVCNVAPLGVIPPVPGRIFEVGRTVTLKPGTQKGGDGNYRALLMPPCSEGPCAHMDQFSPATFLCQLENGFRCCISIKDWIFLERGRDLGIVKRGLDTRFQGDTDRREGISYSEYTGNGSRILIVPITTVEVPGDAGVWVTTMGSFFLKYPLGTSRGALIGEFIHAVGPGSPNGHPHSGGPVTFVPRLVR